MTEDLAKIVRAVRREEALAGLLARFAGVLEGLDSPLKVLLSLSDDLTEIYVRAERGYAIAFARGNPALCDAARRDFEFVAQAASTYLPAQAAEVQRILADRIQLLAGGPEALAKQAEQLATAAERRAAARVLRLARRHAGRDLIGAIGTIQEALLRTVAAPTSSPVQEAVVQYLATVRPNDHAAWRRVAAKIASFSRLEPKLNLVRANGGIAAYTEAEFRGLLATEAGNVQGVLGEVWTWRSRDWLLRERGLVQSGMQRGRRLAFGAEPYRPLVIREPLLVGREELYDGSVLLVREVASRPAVQVYEGFLHGILQVQVRQETELLEVVAKDTARELAKPGGLVVRTLDQTKTIILRSAPDSRLPTRYLVSPELDVRPVVTPGTQVVTLPMLPSRDQINDIVYLFLRSFL